MKVLVTGGTGFIGRYLLRALRQAGHDCRALLRPTSSATELAAWGVELVHGDVTDPASLRGIADGVEVVYHLAAEGHVSAVSEAAYARFRAVNVEGTRHLAEACLDAGVQRFVHFSSTAAMGTPCIRRMPLPQIDETVPCQPVTPYQRSKRDSEEVALSFWRERGLPALVLRPCMVYGPGGQGEFLKMCRLMSHGVFPRVGRGPNLTPLVHVEDVVQAALLAGERGRPGEVYLVASERSFPIAQIRAKVLAALGLRRPYPYLPLTLALAGAFGLELLARWTGRTPPVTRRNLLSSTADRIFDIRKAGRELGYAPRVPLAQGIAQTVAWFREERLL